MNNISTEMIAHFQKRKTKKQKTQFIDLMQQNYPAMIVEEDKHNRNLVFGDIDNASVILTAHYDTCASLPFPNMIFPKNFLITFLYGVLSMFPIIAISIVLQLLVEQTTGNELLAFVLSKALLVLLVAWLFSGKPNPNNANDNTSGIVTLLETMDQLDEEQRRNVAFVLFDNEEKGLLGASFFKKKHKEKMKQTLLINLDCVSDGDTIMLVVSRKARRLYQTRLQNALLPKDGKHLLLAKTSNTFYPSDQILYPYHVGIVALKKHSVLGYYLSKIHTPKDTCFDEANIDLIRDLLIRFLSPSASCDESHKCPQT